MLERISSRLRWVATYARGEPGRVCIRNHRYEAIRTHRGSGQAGSRRKWVAGVRRDRHQRFRVLRDLDGQAWSEGDGHEPGLGGAHADRPVSYTHLTLPTNREV